MNQLELSSFSYRALCERIRAEDPTLDDETLADTVEGLTDLHEILGAVIRSALCDEALAEGLKGRIAEMQVRLGRFHDRAVKRRQIVRDVMVTCEVKKIAAPDFTISLRPGAGAVVVSDEHAIPEHYWQPCAPKLNRMQLLQDLRMGVAVGGAYLSHPEFILSVRTK